MAEGSRSTKRRRTSASPKTIVIAEFGELFKPAKGQETFTRHVDFWLEDGNLILLAGTTALRVYRGLLVKKSAVFADMFAAGSLDASETFDGCPVVRLSDHPEDLRDFLQYLIPCSDLVLIKGVPAPGCVFTQLHAAIHLAHKYQCPDVETRVLFILKKYYTANFTEHDVYDAFKFALFRPMIDGYKRRDGSVEYLSAEDLRLCIDARGALAGELASLVKYVFALTPSAGCRTTRTCAAAREAILENVELNAPREFNVLQSYAECIEEWADVHDLCKVCMRGMLEREVEERRRVWKMLPEIFDLTPEDCGFASGDDSE
ncbi:hypothetical protein LXA43DRAFT_992385 [Ganoderma leucocontextum]|nr:hypothetical protein LXA43DRAFT_992385 [Ganoderma leucocontextum]